MEFLTKGEKTKRQSSEPVTRVLEAGTRSKAEIENEIRMLEQADDTGEMEKNIIAVQDAIKSCETKLQGCYADVSSKVKIGLRDAIEAIEADISRYTDRAVSDLNFFDNLEDINEYLKNIATRYTIHVKDLLEKYDANLRDSIIEQVVSNYHAFSERIQERFANIEGNLTISVELNTMEYTFNVGLAAMEQQEEEVKQQLEQLRIQEEQAQKDNLSAQANMRNQKKNEQRLREIAEQHAEISNRIMPTVIQTSRKEEPSKAFKEKGLFGVIGDFLVAKK